MIRILNLCVVMKRLGWGTVNMQSTPENSAKLTFEKYITKLPNVKLFTNLRGNFWSGAMQSNHSGTVVLKFARRLKAGCGPDGMSDYIGWRQVTITLDMVGSTIAQFCAAEIKRFDGKGRTSVEQIDMIDLIHRQGGHAVIIDSEDKMREAFKSDSNSP